MRHKEVSYQHFAIINCSIVEAGIEQSTDGCKRRDRKSLSAPFVDLLLSLADEIAGNASEIYLITSIIESLANVGLRASAIVFFHIA